MNCYDFNGKFITWLMIIEQEAVVIKKKKMFHSLSLGIIANKCHYVDGGPPKISLPDQTVKITPFFLLQKQIRLGIHLKTNKNYRI